MGAGEKAEGFTFMEVLVAVALLGIAFLIISRLFSHDMRSIAAAGDYETAVVVAQNELDRVLAEKRSIAEEDAVQTVDRVYRVETSVRRVLRKRTDGLGIMLFKVDVRVRWPSGGGYKSYELGTLKLVKVKP